MKLQGYDDRSLTVALLSSTSTTGDVESLLNGSTQTLRDGEKSGSTPGTIRQSARRIIGLAGSGRSSDAKRDQGLVAVEGLRQLVHSKLQEVEYNQLHAAPLLRTEAHLDESHYHNAFQGERSSRQLAIAGGSILVSIAALASKFSCWGKRRKTL